MNVTKVNQAQLEQILSEEPDFNVDFLCPIEQIIMTDPVNLNCYRHVF